jgi:hypothetical protein
MASEPNFLLGKGERLTSEVNIARGGGGKRHPYTFSEAKEHLKPLAKKAISEIESLPAKACPNDEAVAMMTLHPAYLAKSHHPDELLRAVGLRPVGSRPVTITPRKTVDGDKPEPAAAAEIFVAGPRAKLKEFASALPRWNQHTAGSGDLIKIEDFRAEIPSQRVRNIPSDVDTPLLEIVLHAGDGVRSASILESFKDYLSGMNVVVDLDRWIDAGELSFVPVRVPKHRIEDVAKFSFLRVARMMPRLRELTPLSSDSGPASQPFVCSLPEKQPLDPRLRVVWRSARSAYSRS